MEPVLINLADLAGVFGQQPDAFLKQFEELGEDSQPKPITAESVLPKLTEYGKAEFQRYLEEGRRSGVRTRMNEYDENIRKTYGLSSRAEGEKLVEEVVGGYKSKMAKLEADLEAARKLAEGKGKEMTPDQEKAFIVNHPFFNEKLAEKDAEAAAIKTEYEQFKGEVEQRMTIREVEKAALLALEKYRPVVHENPVIAETYKKAFLAELLSSAKYQIDGETIKAFDSKGEPVKDGNYRELTFEGFVNSIAAKYYDQHPAAPDKGTPGPGGGGKRTEGGVEIPDWSKMSKEAITQYVLNEKDPAKQQILKKSAMEFLQ